MPARVHLVSEMTILCRLVMYLGNRAAIVRMSVCEITPRARNANIPASIDPIIPTAGPLLPLSSAAP